EGGQDHLVDTILATPNDRTPVPQDSMCATAPGLEQPARTPQFTFNVLAPALFNSNAQFLRSGGSETLEGTPLVRLGWSSQLFDLPIRISTAASAETERFADAPGAASDYIAPPQGRETSILPMTRAIRPSCLMHRGSTSLPLSRTTSPFGTTSISVSTRCSGSTARLPGFRPVRAVRAGMMAGKSGGRPRRRGGAKTVEMNHGGG